MKYTFYYERQADVYAKSEEEAREKAKQLMIQERFEGLVVWMK